MANTANRRTVIFEQPEIHLHPAAQAQLADLFVEYINDKNGAVNRILIETHSEYLIRKLQVLVADPDKKISDDQVAIYYVDKDEKGDSYVEKMKLCENGQFEKAWPTGFFDKSYELTKMLMEANSKLSAQEK
jgi:predicted ATPase